MESALKACCLSAFDKRSHLSVIGEGFYNKNYLMRFGNTNYVLRVPKTCIQYDLRMFKEGCILRFLQDTNFRFAPQILFSSESPEFIVIEYIEGGVRNIDYKIDDLLYMLTSLHSADPLGLVTTESPIFKDRFYNFGVMQMAAYKELLERWMPGLSSRLSRDAPSFSDVENRRQVLLHGDPARSNFIQCADGTVRIIDFEFAAIGDPLFDFAFLLNRTFPSDLTALEKIIAIAGTRAKDVLKFAIFDVARSIHVVASKYLDATTAEFDLSRGSARIEKLLCHRAALNAALVTC